MKRILLLLSIVFSMTLNGIMVLATEVPKAVQFVSVKKENFELHDAKFQVEIKHIENVPNPTIERQINTLIDRYINDKIATVKKELDEIAKTGGKILMEVDLNLSDYYVHQELVSFSLDFLQVMASAFEEKQYHNIDLTSGKEVLLEHWIGKDYASIVKDEVIKQINQQNKENGTDLYFMDEVNKLSIKANQSYYINKDGQIVVTFPKYSIAPGYVGLPEFTMPYNIKEVKA